MIQCVFIFRMFKQLLQALWLTALAQASFVYVQLVTNVESLIGLVHTKGFLAYEGGPTSWSASSDIHPYAAKTLTTTFSGVKSNFDVNSNHVGLTVQGSYWGDFPMYFLYQSGAPQHGEHIYN